MRRPLLCSVLTVLTVLALSPLSGCYFSRSPTRPVAALEMRREARVRQDCLVVMLPGFLDGPDTYREHGFGNELLGSGAACDAVAVDLHYRYYGEMGLGEVVYEDVLAPATARGYDEIWLVGISMGGLGALLAANRHPELVDGIILLSPFVGDASVVAQVRDAGGLAEWTPPEHTGEWTESDYTLRLWTWLRGYVTDPDGMPPLWIGWGEGEDLEGPDSVLAAALPEGHVFHIPGRHAWSTWRPLFREVLASARPGR